MRITLTIARFALLALCAVGPGRADDDIGWRLRVDLAFVDPGTDSSTGQGTAFARFDTGSGIGVRGEYQFSRRLGIDFGFLAGAGVDVSASAGTTATFDVGGFTPLIVGADFHLTPGERVDLYIGPQIAAVEYSEVEFFAARGSAGSSISIDRSLGLGAVLGLDVPVGEKRHWALQTSLRYLATSMDGGGAGNRIDVDFDPVIFSVGFGYRW